MKHIVIIFILYSLSNSSYAVTAEELYAEFFTILKICKKDGFYKCENRYFEGTSRGIFHIPIEKQRLKLTEIKYKNFIKNHFENDLNVSFLTKRVYINFDLDDNFDLSRFRPSNMKGKIKSLNKENTFFKFSFKNAPPLVLLSVDNKFKIGILPKQEEEYNNSKESSSVYIYRLKNNILQYHMKEAEILKYDKSTFKKKVNEALESIVYKIKNAKISKFAKNLKSRSFKDIQDFYMPLDTESKIITKIKAVNKL